MTFYLKYRPKTIDELDLIVVRERLGTIVKTGRFSHAYLFSGPRGTGKTSAARILAHEAGAEGVDTIEIDAASHRGIDDIREIRERVGFRPMVGEKKAYIIDEVHMLTVEAFNALLKTLEEPPSHVFFFLCTTELAKVPTTIQSRCVVIPFPRATEDEILRSLKRAATSEKLLVSEDGLQMIAQWADGSFRDAHTFLEEAASQRPKGTISVTDVERIVGGSLVHDVIHYVTSVIAGDGASASRAVDDIVHHGGDLMVFSRLVLEALRDQLVKHRTDRVLLVTKKVEECTRTLKYALLPQLPLQIAAMELTESRSTSGRGHPERAERVEGSPPKAVAGGRRQDHSVPIQTPIQSSSPPVPTSLSISDLVEKWPQFLDAVRKKNHGIVTLLTHCTPTTIEGNTVIIEAKYEFHKDQLMQERFRSLIEGALHEVIDRHVGIRFVLGEQTEHVLRDFPGDDNIRAVAEDELSSIAEEVFLTP